VGLARGHAIAYLYVSDALLSVVQNGIHWEIDPANAVLVDILTLAGTPGVYDEGVGTCHLAIPDDPNLVGQTVYYQWIIRDTSAPGGFATSKAAELTYY